MDAAIFWNLRVWSQGKNIFSSISEAQGVEKKLPPPFSKKMPTIIGGMVADHESVSKVIHFFKKLETKYLYFEKIGKIAT